MKNKIVKFLKKYWFIIAILIISLARFLFTYKLPSFFIKGMNYDDELMIRQLTSFLRGNYLGTFDHKTLIKGPLFPMLLFLIRFFKLSYSSIFTLLYICSCIYFIYSLKYITKEKEYLIIIFILLLFNPVTYSQDLFQRLYRNSISITELVFFLGSVIRVLYRKEKKVYDYVLLGLSLSLLFLTREDNLWTYPVLVFIFLYNTLKIRKIKNVILNLIPILLLMGVLNLVSFINYKYYGIYTYNEIQKSEFHNTYKKILQIKDDEKKETISIPKSTIYKLADKSKTFDISRENIDLFYELFSDDNGEIYNGNFIWYFRNMIYSNKKFKSGKESEEYYKKLGEEIDELFENGTFQKEFTMPSSFMAVPTKKQIKILPKEILKTIIYTTTYKDIKTLTRTFDLNYNKYIKAYNFVYVDYHHTVNIVKINSFIYELFRIIYFAFTTLFSIIALFIYAKNINKLDSINIFSSILMICYLLIIFGVTYTHITSFHAVRPIYLGNVYIIQNIFILINLYRIKKVKNY